MFRSAKISPGSECNPKYGIDSTIAAALLFSPGSDRKYDLIAKPCRTVQ